ncbi:CsbD family protein [Bradyrhizobium sp. BRP22]|uniref:CsbD family protein n=1 Tax=Bradyrhizobium sp. BRP22 TaxID=2793821 RepID=UPI001CD5519F|nr:CsbD family protein [Bradyrhizobium sp. BRP22]MCA1454059.1 CsbD family protein [Bradyrhizobium sp. BRP22]
MVKLKDKVTGKLKQVVAEVVGDGKLQQEGKKQEEKAKEKPNELNPLGDLNQLT